MSKHRQNVSEDERRLRENMWKLNEDDDCINSRHDGYFLNEDECKKYKKHRDIHLNTIAKEDSSAKWDFNKMKDGVEKWCESSGAGEYASFKECEERRLLHLNVVTLEQQYQRLVPGLPEKSKDLQTDKRDTGHEKKLMEFAEKAIQVMDFSTSSEEKLRAELEGARSDLQKMNIEYEGIVRSMRQLLQNSLDEYFDAEKAEKRANNRLQRGMRRKESLQRTNAAREKGEIARDSLRFKTAVNEEARQQCKEAFQKLDNCTREKSKVARESNNNKTAVENVTKKLEEVSRQLMECTRKKEQIGRDTSKFKREVENARQRLEEVSQDLHECAEEKNEIAQKSNDYKTAKEDAEEQLEEALQELQVCAQEAEARRRRSVVALRTTQMSVFVALLYFLRYVRNYKQFSGLTKPPFAMGNSAQL